MDFVYLNEIIGRSEYGQLAAGSVSMQDSIMLNLYASPDQRQRFLEPLVGGLAKQPAAFWTVKALSTVTTIYFAEQLWRQNKRKQAIVTMVLPA